MRPYFPFVLPSFPEFPPLSTFPSFALPSVGATIRQQVTSGLRAAASEWYWDTIHICVIGLDQPYPPPPSIPPVASVKSELKSSDNSSCAVQRLTGAKRDL